MRVNQFLTLLFFFIFLSCGKREEYDVNASRVVELYSEEDFKTKIQIIDTVCINDSLKAVNDFKNGKSSLIVNHFIKSNFYHFFDTVFRKDLTYELAKFKIKPDFDVSYPTCIPLLGNNMFKTDCYQSALESEILKRYKYDLLDSIKTVIERKYVLRYNNDILSFESRDQPRYDDFDGDDPAYDFLCKLSIDFTSQVKYPEGYNIKKKKPDDYSYSTARFILMKDGSIKDLSIKTTFQNPVNKKFISYFEKQIIDFIKSKKKWVHPTYAGLIVNNGMEFSVFYK